MTSKVILVSVLLCACGCTTQPMIEATHQWEGHYFNVNDFKNGTSGICLGDGESIWVMSNNTLNRLLRNTKR